MKQIKIYVRDESEEAYNVLKDFDVNVQTFLRKAMKDKAKEILMMEALHKEMDKRKELES